MGNRRRAHEAVCAAMLDEVERDQEGGCVVDVNLNAAGWGVWVEVTPVQLDGC